MDKVTKEYKNDDITIVWKPELCIHSANCWKGLISVFDPKKRPWINPYGATSERIIQQIKECPSEALSYYTQDKDEMKNNETTTRVKNNNMDVNIIKDGPIMIHENVTIHNSDGSTIQRKNPTALCRCGYSNKKPYCDGAHINAKFKG